MTMTGGISRVKYTYHTCKKIYSLSPQCPISLPLPRIDIRALTTLGPHPAKQKWFAEHFSMLDYIHLPGVRTGRISRDQFLSQLNHRNWSIITDDLGILSVVFHKQEIFKKLIE